MSSDDAPEEEEITLEEAYAMLVGEVALLIDTMSTSELSVPVLTANFSASVLATIHINRNTTIH